MALFNWLTKRIKVRHNLMLDGTSLFAFLEDAPSPIALLVGPEHRFALANASYRKWFLAGRHVLGQSVSEALPEALEHGLIAHLDNVFTTGESHAGKEGSLSYRLEKGQLYRIQFNYYYQAVRNRRGKIYGVIVQASDVTDVASERDQADALRFALTIEKENIKRLYAESPSYFIIWRGPEFIYEVSNPVSDRIVGCNPVGRRLVDVLPQVKASEVLALLRRVRETGKSIFLPEVRVDFPEGPRYFEVNYVARKNHHDDIDGVIATGADVTQRVLYRRKLEQSEKDLARAVQVAKVGFYDWDVRSDHVSMSPEFQRIYRVGEGASLQTTLESIHPEDRSSLRDDVHRALEETHRLKARYRVITESGEPLWLESMGEVTCGEDGRPDHFFGTIRDITDLKITADALVLQQHLNQSMIDQSPAGIALMRGEELIFTSVNARWTQMVSARSYLGRSLQETYSDLERIGGVQDGLRQAFHYAKPFHLPEIEVRVPKDGQGIQKRVFTISAFQVLDGVGKPFGVFCQISDITDAAQARDKLQASVEDLRHERELRECFVAALTHDMRSPLASIKIYAQHLAQHHADGAAVEKFASRITRAIDRADHMVQNLLDANRVRAGEPVLIYKTPCNLTSLFNETMHDLGHLHERTFTLQIPQAALIVECDGEAIRRVLDNLVGNAVKYGTPETAITVALTVEQDYVQFSVHNWGAPISHQERGTLFKLYQRTRDAMAGGQKGWGIGLSLVKAVTLAHGGKLDVASSTAEGTCFTVVLPKKSQPLVTEHTTCLMPNRYPRPQ